MPMIRALFALFLLFAVAPVVEAHSWYDTACCSSRDCEQLPDTAVTIERGGYHVRYVGSLGFHVDVLVPFDKAKPSRDEHYHGCASIDRFLCLYAPVNT